MGTLLNDERLSMQLCYACLQAILELIKNLTDIC